MFWTAVAWAFLSAMVAHYVMLLFYMPTAAVEVAIYKYAIESDGSLRSRVLFWLWVPINLGYSYYIMTAWGAWCAYGGLAFALDPGTDHPWGYYLLAFAVCSSVLSGMIGNDDDPGFATDSSCIVAALSCILFMIFPSWIPTLHWWWLQYARLLYGG